MPESNTYRQNANSNMFRKKHVVTVKTELNKEVERRVRAQQ